MRYIEILNGHNVTTSTKVLKTDDFNSFVFTF